MTPAPGSALRQALLLLALAAELAAGACWLETGCYSEFTLRGLEDCRCTLGAASHGVEPLREAYRWWHTGERGDNLVPVSETKDTPEAFGAKLRRQEWDLNLRDLQRTLLSRVKKSDFIKTIGPLGKS